MSDIIEAVCGVAIDTSASMACCPTLKNADVGGVRDADGEPRKFGRFLNKMPGYAGKVPD